VRPCRRCAGHPRQRGDDRPGAPAPGLPPQQKSRQARARDTPRLQPARPDYRQRLTARDLRRVKGGDEARVQLALTRLYGRAPAGERAVGSVPQTYGPTVPRLGALGIQGRQAVMTVDGASDAEVFRPDVTPVWGPTLSPGASVVMDHGHAHKAVGGQPAMARRGARRLYWPPDSPALSPIEPGWSTVKTALRKVKARPRAMRDTAIAEALLTVSHADAWGGFKHCGSPLQSCANRSRPPGDGNGDAALQAGGKSRQPGMGKLNQRYFLL
jgi:transposase